MKNLIAPIPFLFFLFLSVSTTVSAQSTVQQLNSIQSDESLFGSSVGLGDFNDDGLQDLSVNLSRFTFNNTVVRTQTYLYFSSVSKPAETFFSAYTSDDGGVHSDSFDWFGEVIRSGDLNGDGFDDLLISAPNASVDGGIEDIGCVHIFYGDGTQPLFTGRQTLCGATAYQHFGENMAVGDLNRDGFDDLAVYSANEVVIDDITRTPGIVSVFFGDKNGLPSTPEMTLQAPDKAFQFGHSLLIAELNGMDLIVGAPRDETNGFNAGKVFIYSGTNGLKQFSSTPVHSIAGSDTECLGTSLAVGELFGSQGIDLVVGAGNRHNGDGCGAQPDDQVQVFTGLGDSTVSEKATFVFDGYDPVVGQLQASGYQDLVIIDESKVGVYYGHPLGLPTTPDLELPQTDLRSVTLGDLTGDARDDLVVSFIDANGDGVVSIFGIDECPDDPDKISAGSCGCGIPEIDNNNNGVSDCDSTEEVRFYATSGRSNLKKYKNAASAKKFKRKISQARKQLRQLATRDDIKVVAGAGVDIQKELKAVSSLMKRALKLNAPAFKRNKKKALRRLKKLLALLA